MFFIEHRLIFLLFFNIDYDFWKRDHKIYGSYVIDVICIPYFPCIYNVGTLYLIGMNESNMLNILKIYFWVKPFGENIAPLYNRIKPEILQLKEIPMRRMMDALSVGTRRKGVEWYGRSKNKTQEVDNNRYPL